MELPFKRQRKSDHGLETLESFINGKSYGLLLSRLPEDFKLLDEHLNISFFPKVNERNGGLSILFAENKEKLEEFKNWSNKYVKIQRTEFIITGRKKQIDFMVIFKQIKKTLKKCFFEFEDREMQKNHKQITSRTASSQNEEMCDRIKKLSEDLIINYYEELILGFKSFENEESIDYDWKFNEFSRKIFLATLCFIQVKLQRIQLKQVLYFFNRFQGYELLKRFKRFRTIEKVYIVEILFQLAFEKQPFRKENEEEIYISTTSINFEINYMIIKRENSEKLEKILLSFNQKYFPSIESTKFAAMVRHYISSIKIVGLPNALSGITLMNSVVLISNRNFLKIKEFENNESSKRSTEEGLKACEDSEDSDDFQPALQEASEEKYAGPIGFFFLTAIHEFAHFVQRAEFTKMFEWFSFHTPSFFLLKAESETKRNSSQSSLELGQETKGAQFIQSDNSTKAKRTILNPEDGECLIKNIFGYEVDFLDHFDALFILDLKNWELPEEKFQELFKIEAERKNPEKFKKYPTMRCKSSSSLPFIIFGECGTACGVKFTGK